MRPPACTVAHRVSKQSPQHPDAAIMPKDIYRFRRAQLIHHPRASKPLGPIGLLPTEVLAHIFRCCVRDECSTSAQNALLVLTQVCSSWRRTALRIPQLWANLSLNLTTKPVLPSTSPFARPTVSPSPSSAEALTNLASLWFERAKNQLLSVSIKLTANNATAFQDVSSSLTGPILSNAHSVRHLTIQVTSSSQLREFFSRSHAKFINLESLSLSIQHFDTNSSSSSPITIFNNSSRLRRVSLDLNGRPPSRSLIHLPWAQLKQFSMTGASILPADECRALLSACTNLEKASVWVEDSLDGIDLDKGVSKVILHNLTHLSVSFYGRDVKAAHSLLTAFDFPHLRHFHLFSGFVTLPFMPPITSRRLETITLSGVDFSAAELADFAAKNSSLRSLALDLRYFTTDISTVLGVLATCEPGPGTFPHLSSLSLWTRDISPHSAAYSRIIRARGRNSFVPLRLALYLARQQHGACCHFSTCSNPSKGNPLDDILSVVDVCEKTKGVELYITNVKPDEGITEVVW